jgi:anti-anti-sigma regulatory factor
MAPEESAEKIEVHKEIGELLMLRSTVAPIFRKLARLPSHRVIVDFSGVEFMSRSFADEYLAAKAACQKKINERNLSSEVRRMLQLVSSQRESSSSKTSSGRQSIRPPRAVSL